jgi:hypothetical protein
MRAIQEFEKCCVASFEVEALTIVVCRWRLRPNASEPADASWGPDRIRGSLPVSRSCGLHPSSAHHRQHLISSAHILVQKVSQRICQRAGWLRSSCSNRLDHARLRSLQVYMQMHSLLLVSVSGAL